jgi:hypothetical protein
LANFSHAHRRDVIYVWLFVVINLSPPLVFK